MTESLGAKPLDIGDSRCSLPLRAPLGDLDIASGISDTSQVTRRSLSHFLFLGIFLPRPQDLYA